MSTGLLERESHDSTGQPTASTITPAVWGVSIHQRRTRVAGTTRRVFPIVATNVLLLFVVLLGGSGIAVASAGDARADFLGIGEAVEDWLCGVVQPTEPWEAVGDGPESWMSNRNLAGVTEPDLLQAAADGTLTSVPATQTTPPATMDQLRALPDGQYTLYEIAGLRGLEWWTIPMSADGTSRNCSLWAFLWTHVGNFVFSGNKILLQLVISIKEAAAAPNPLAFLYDASGGVLSDVFALFFIPIATLMFLCTAIWIGIQAAKGKMKVRKSFGAVGAGFAIVVLTAFLYSVASTGSDGFRQVAKLADEAIGQGTAAATGALFNWMTDGTQACALDADATAERGERVTSCVLADTLAYRPWAVGQFGAAGVNPIPIPEGLGDITMPDATGVILVAGTEALEAALAADSTNLPVETLQGGLPCYVNFQGCTDLRTYLIAQHGGVQIGTIPSGETGFGICRATVAGIVIAKMGDDEIMQAIGRAVGNITGNLMCSPMFRVFVLLSKSDIVTAGAYAGDVGIARVSQAFTALIGTLVAGVAVLIIALITMSWHAMTYVLYLMGPFKLAFAVYAGKVKLATEWLGDLAYAWLARFAYGVVLALVILLIVWLFNSTQSFGYRLLWLGVILWLMFKMVAKIQQLIRPGAASMDVDVAGAVTGGSKKAIQRSYRSSVGGVDGVRDSARRTRASLNDPTHGKLRRTVTAAASPFLIVGGGTRGAVTGRTGSERRLEKAVAAAGKVGHIPGKPGGTDKAGSPSKPGHKGPGRQTGTGTGSKTPRRAGSPHPTAVDVRDVAKPVKRQPRPLRKPVVIPKGPAPRRAGSPHPTAVDVREVAKPVPRRPRTPPKQTPKEPPKRVVVQPVARPQSAPKKPAPQREGTAPRPNRVVTPTPVSPSRTPKAIDPAAEPTASPPPKKPRPSQPPSTGRELEPSRRTHD